uniref:MADF domain-containing protein n=1 Tax=Cyclopterus lumpus TaxID=8103 RepID=A0A8C2Z8S6_CYCLU
MTRIARREKKKWRTLTIAVCGHPEIFNTSSYDYRNRLKKDVAWKAVSEDVGIPVEVCRKKWKGLRDTYLKEKRRATDKRSGSGAGSLKKWKYSAVLSFLDPFITPRETSGNMGERDIEEQLLTALRSASSAPPPSEDELFLKSLLPSLERLPPQQKDYVKFQIHKLIYEASTVVLNLENVE